MKNPKKGFTLTEMMIAIGMLGLVIITLLGVFLNGLQSIKKSKYRAMALRIANQKYDELNEIDWTMSAGVDTSDMAGEPAGVIGGYDVSKTSAETTIRWDNLDPNQCVITGKQTTGGIDYRFTITIDGYMINIKKVTVLVEWNEPDGVKKVRLCTLISRKA